MKAEDRLSDREMARLRVMKELLACKEFPSDWEQTRLAIVDKYLKKNTRPQRRQARFAFVAAASVLLMLGTAYAADHFLPVSYGLHGKLPLSMADLRVNSDSASNTNVHFRDGTDITFLSSAEGDIERLTKAGATITLEQGRLHASVRLRPLGGWFFRAGPYQVESQGTKFDMEWEPTRGMFDFVLHEGTAVLTGPMGTTSLTAGQRFHMDGQEANNSAPLKMAEASSVPVPASPLDPGPTLDPEGVLPNEQRPIAPPNQAERAASVQASWRELLGEGKFYQILHEARAMGIDQALHRGSADDLSALADAARYAGDRELAKRALFALRDEHPTHPKSFIAAFLLARIAEDHDKNLEGAFFWYERYLKESPSGIFSADASGRRMVLLHQLGKEAEASAAAEAYLKQFPNGSYRNMAQSLLDEAR